MKNKDVSTISDSVYNDSDEHVDTIIDSIKQVEAINDPIKETHIFDVISTLSIRVGSLEPSVKDNVKKFNTSVQSSTIPKKKSGIVMY